jgi:ABC-type Zn uptake system ZnuABC Zn-binding protein ZnuA
LPDTIQTLTEVPMFRLPWTVLLVVLGVLAFLAASCGSGGDNGSDGSSGKLKVVTTVSPLTSLAENIGGTRIELLGLIPEGVNSHTYEPPVSDIKALSEADLIIINGLKLEEPALELARANKKDGAIILILGDTTITPEQYKYDFSFPRDGGKPNPHLWPNPAFAMEYARLIHDRMVALDPANAGYFDANFDELMRRLEALDQAMRDATASVPEENRRLLTYHDSWAYWADRYGFSIIGAIQPSDFAEPSAKEVADLIDQINAEKLPAIFGSDVFPSPVLEQIAAETGAEYIDDLRDDDLPGKPGDPLHSYIGLMVENMRIMIPPLGGDASALDTVDAGLVFNDGPSPARYPQ